MKTILLIDDHAIVRLGLESLVRSCDDLRLVASAASLAEGLAVIERVKPDIVVTDMGLGDSGGLDTVRAVIAAQQPRPTLVMSMQDEMLYGEQALALGARGYLMKETAHTTILPAVMEVLAGGTWISPQLAARMLNRLMRRNGAAAAAAPRAESLSARELEVLEQLKLGRSTKEIARELRLSGRTVDIHRANIKRKLGLRTGAELIAFAANQP